MFQDRGWSCFNNSIGQYAQLSVILLLMAACSSGDNQVAKEIMVTEQQLAGLKQALTVGTLRNANIIQQYASVLTASRPELALLLTEFKKEATLSNPTYQNLISRFRAIKDNTEHFDSWVDKVDELQRIKAAADVTVFNDALSDTVNVMADLSKGELARVNAVAKQTELSMNQAKDFGAGSQYVGNPHYGSWSHRAGGSFWAWYGQYALFSNLLGGNRHYYHDWAGRRGYSYYHDVGRNNYTSRTQRTSQNNVQQRAQKQFGRGNFRSPYTKSRSGAAGISKASAAQQKSLFNSPYAKDRRNSGQYQSSARSSSYRTSRSISRGK